MNDLQWKVFFDIHKDLPREGPGSNELTEKAWNMLDGVPEKPEVLDIGCGPGMQTFKLAELTGGTITAVDTWQPYLDKIAEAAEQKGLDKRVITKNASMMELPFAPGSFDVVWAEGSIYIMGFGRGLQSVYEMLKPGGWFAASELSWFKPDAPKTLRAFWEEGYPGMQTVEGNRELISAAGFALAGDFNLPDNAWRDEYYDYIEQRLPQVKELYKGNEEAQAVIEAEELEIKLHKEYSEYFGYTFFIMRKP